MRKLLVFVLALIFVAAPFAAVTNAAPARQALPKVDLVMWHQEGEDVMKSLNLQNIFDTWAKTNAPGSTLTLVAKDTEALRTEFQSSALAGSGGPDILWTVADQAGPFTTAGVIQPVDDVVDTSLFIPTIVNITQIDGKTYGVPLQAGNHLMMYYNKKYVKDAPATFADLVKVSKDLQQSVKNNDKFVPLAYRQDQSFWAFPVAIGYGGTAFTEDGKTPALNTDAWLKTYQFFYDLKYSDKITPPECDYDCMDGNFKSGNAAIIFNGDWALGGDTGYVKTLGDNLGIAPWPLLDVASTSTTSDATAEAGSGREAGRLAPYVAGKYIMLRNSTTGDKLTTASAFIKFLTTDEATVLSYTVPNGRLPALLSALSNEKVTGDPVLKLTSAALLTGVAQPVQPEMRCVFDGVTTSIVNLNSGAESDVKVLADNAQKAAEDCISKLG